MDEELKDLLLAIKHSLEMTNARFDGLEMKVDERMDGLEKKVDERMDGLEKKLDRLESELKLVKREVRDVRRTMYGFGKDLDDTLDRLDRIDQQVQ